MNDQNIIENKRKRVTLQEIKDGCIKLNGDDDTEAEVCMVQEELRQGISTIQSYKTSATFYGSARLTDDHPDYQRAQRLAYRISKELGYAVLSGGGPGIMEAANRGAFEAGGKSVGLTIKLNHEQVTNKYVNDEIPFYFFFTRKVSMHYATDACLFFPGGFGTLDELFETITLKQTNKIDPIPVILVGSDYWNKFQDIIKSTMLEKYETITEEDLKMYTITDDEDEVIRIIKESKVRKS
ncbi:TIGR00730 family Rossman fold protein [Candidatus Nomurabacteria bacterium]|nr:TIGR00730 family Rossman fold protein [Candidatus Nomurabacteria bacterium]